MSNAVKAAVVDTSVLICIAKGEAASEHFLRELAGVHELVISAPTHAETILATMAIQAAGAMDAMKELIDTLRIETVSFGAADLTGYKAAAANHHFKAKTPGLLNLGDIFSFQLAMKMDFPLFFQGKDFLTTPVKNAMGILGYEMTVENLGVPTKTTF